MRAEHPMTADELDAHLPPTHPLIHAAETEWQQRRATNPTPTPPQIEREPVTPATPEQTAQRIRELRAALKGTAA